MTRLDVLSTSASFLPPPCSSTSFPWEIQKAFEYDTEPVPQNQSNNPPPSLPSQANPLDLGPHGCLERKGYLFRGKSKLLGLSNTAAGSNALFSH